MRRVERFVVVSAPLRRDAEQRRWYGPAAESCLVLSRRGRLLEPHPVFGPTSYRLIARKVDVVEAREYAARQGLRNERIMPCSNA